MFEICKFFIQKLMKFISTTILFLLPLISLEIKTAAITNYEIKKICDKSKLKSDCIYKLKIKKDKLLKGNRIEIPVLPFRNK